ncbi:hypothetical protein [Hathewaya limosa]|uniref:Lipoprotein n=1 Tax=Hathewaya limosa TaxID=1536 RepID=A0ABU0JRS5_HATLI|nr:hypothetical protein [Hathewaya limosa]MDQ0479773.1 hypothetical protein [Hathewaya limosa]
MKKKIIIGVLVIIIIAIIGFMISMKDYFALTEYTDYIVEANDEIINKNYDEALKYANKAQKLRDCQEVADLKKSIDNAKHYDYNNFIDEMNKKNYSLAKVYFDKLENKTEKEKAIKLVNDTVNNSYKEIDKLIKENKIKQAKELISNTLSFNYDDTRLLNLQKQCIKLENKNYVENVKEKNVVEQNNYKPQLITNSDNLKIWKVYLLAGKSYIFKINVSNGEDSNVIVHLGEKLLINEIGKGNFAGEVSVLEDGWYRLKIETNMGYSWKFE